MPGALEDIRVLDLSQGIAGPLTTLLLAEQGADVIRVEPPGGDPFRDVYPGYFIWNRSKRSVTLDLGSEPGRARLHTGHGQWVDTSLHDGAALLTSIVWQWTEHPTPAFAERMGKKEPYRPWLYESADGLWLHRMLTAKGNAQVIANVLGIEP